MENKDYKEEMDNLSGSLKNLLGLGYAVYESIFRGAFTPATYEGAVFILIQEIQRLSEQAEMIVKDVYTSVYTEVKK
ncbi:MAG: hypothetical protein IIU86_03700 [Oscillospiraceae bacterium]|nr:hypothetical protein [Oscillospiraceae bacterium]